MQLRFSWYIQWQVLACAHNDNCYTDNVIIADPSSCYNQFFSKNEINTNSLSITSVIPVTDTRVFPDIHFTCTGIITNWLIGITEEQDTTKPYPNIYIKRSSQLIHALTVDASAAISSNGNVYNFTSEVMVQSGDILVINVTNNSNPMYYQQYNGPLNYKLNNDELITLEDNDYPLVSVIISKLLLFYWLWFLIEPRMSTNEANMVTVVTESLYSSITATLYSIPISSVVTSHSTSLTSLSSTSLLITHSSTTIQSSTGDNNTTTLIAAVISTVLILLVVSILVIIIVSVLMYKRRKRLTLEISTGNHVYSETTSVGDDKGMKDMSNPNYQPQGIILLL